MTAVALTLQMSRFTLRPLTLEDERSVMTYRGDPRLSQFLSRPPMTLGEYPAWLAERAPGFGLQGPGDRCYFGVESKVSGQLMGDVLLRLAADDVQQGEIGMILHADAKGQGYAVEIGQAVLSLAFDQMGLHRIAGRADELNVPSRRGMERLGMRLEGHFLKDTMRDGQWVNTVSYALLREEWQSQRRA
ncbi:GNAT family N-acetyltransferase [Arthrobacter agilis]|uniref:GNAT family N-acetyltransferase n=1 Tax=Arthrobacter agilis TaxID=37921 RepID=UPI002788308C|nr:GNAT family protein [Arthrobacter agilis]MDQ0734795.1 RimJ/RimL family protein N-acetyltransferase [Arthrobacter agilis]